jgi:hypothetical protein
VAVYYASRAITVTGDAIIVDEPIPKRYRLDDLQRIHVARPRARNGFMAPFLGVLTLLFVAATWTVLDTPAAYVVGVLAIAIGVGGAWAVVRQRGANELRASYRGVPIVIYLSDDAAEFARVCRAVVRAVEAGGPNASQYGVFHHPTQ